MGTPRTEYRDIGGPADPSPYSTPRPEYRDIAPAADDVPPSSTEDLTSSASNRGEFPSNGSSFGS